MNINLPHAPLRRELSGLLVDFKKSLENSPWGPLSMKIQKWLCKFQEAMKTENLRPVEVLFLNKLQRKLVDPIFHVPLNEDSVFGTDGLVYERKALRLYLAGFQGIAPFHQPRFCQNPPEITVELLEADSIVPKLVRWIKDKQAFHPNQLIENVFAGALELPPLPTKDNEDLRCLRENLITQRLKKELLVQLEQFGEFFDKSSRQDNTTEHLRTWQRNFTAAVLQTRNVDATLIEFIQDLQTILQDPIFQCILDEEPLLGSDGWTYSKKGLSVLFHEIPNHLNISVEPHPVAALMIQWLISLDCYQPNLAIEELYQQLVDRGQLPELPTEENRLIAELREQEAERQSQNQREPDPFAEATLHEMLGHVAHAFAPVDEKIEQDGRELIQAVLDRRPIDEQALDVILNRLEVLNQNIQQFDARVDFLRAGIVKVNGDIAHVNQQNANLSQAIAEAREALKEREKGWLKALLTTVVIIGACAAGTAILQSIASKGLTTTVTPPLKGGFGGMLNLGFKI